MAHIPDLISKSYLHKVCIRKILMELYCQWKLCVLFDTVSLNSFSFKVTIILFPLSLTVQSASKWTEMIETWDAERNVSLSLIKSTNFKNCYKISSLKSIVVKWSWHTFVRSQKMISIPWKINKANLLLWFTRIHRCSTLHLS